MVRCADRGVKDKRPVTGPGETGRPDGRNPGAGRTAGVPFRPAPLQ
jgi:hypothetical protein